VHRAVNETMFFLKVYRICSAVWKKIRPYHAIVLTFQAGPIKKDISTPAIIARVNFNNIMDADEYEPPQKIKSFYRFLSEGDIGYYAYLNGRFVHRSWVTFGPKKVTRWNYLAPFWIRENEAVIHWCETVPDARGNNIYPAVLSEIKKDLKAEAIYIFTTLDNISSIRGIAKAGFVLVDVTRVVGILGFSFNVKVNRDKISEKVRVYFENSSTSA